jgi:hypothetical protein
VPYFWPRDERLRLTTFSEDEYQSCSGIGHGANKKTVVEKKDSTGAEQAAEKLRNSV